jgi:hypothetical protein
MVDVGSPAPCSGAMYAGVPIDVPICVSVAPGADDVRAALIAFAIPEIRDDRGALDSSTLSGLMSRWTTPCRCAYASAFDVAQHADDLGGAQRSAREPGAQRFAVDEGHRIERQPLDVAGREDRNDVRLLQRGGRLDLALEAAHRQSLRQLGRQNLDGDFTLEAELLGFEDAAHAAAPELALEAVSVAESFLELCPEIRSQWGLIVEGRGEE